MPAIAARRSAGRPFDLSGGHITIEVRRISERRVPGGYRGFALRWRACFRVDVAADGAGPLLADGSGSLLVEKQSMLTVKCPHCTTALKLRQQPPSGKVKCPKCSKVIALPGSTKPAMAGKSASSGRSAPANRPARDLDPDDDGFDFGQVSFPSSAPAAAVSHFPVAGQNMRVYDGPIPGDPLETATEEDVAAANQQAGGGGQRPKKQTSPMVVIGALAGVGVLVIGAVIVGVVMSGSGGSGGDTVDPLVQLKASAPDGYQAVGHQGCIALVPKGRDVNTLRDVNVIGPDCTIVESSASGSTFFFGAMDGGTREIDADQMRKKAGRQLGGEILGGTPVTRKGYEGIKGKLDGSLFVTNMMVEIYHVDGRFVILGCAPASFEADPTVQMAVDRQLEQEEQDVFYKSFEVGPRPSGWLF